MADESKSYSDVLSRRRFAQLTGVTGAAALAGCNTDDTGGTDEPADNGGNDDDDGSDDSDSSDSSESESMGVMDVTHVSGTDKVPNSLQYNLWGSKTPSISDNLIFDKFANFNYADGEYKPGILSDWEFTGDTFEMKIQEGATWHNGDAVTSEDFKTFFEGDRHIDSAIWDWADEIKTPDDQTVVLTVGSEVNPSLVEFSVLENQLHTKADVYSEPINEIKNDSESTALAEFTVKDPIGNGIFKHDEADAQVQVTKRFEDHPQADNVNFKEYKFQYLEGNTAIFQALKAGQIDSMFNVAAKPNVMLSFPDAVEEVRTPTNGGLGMVPNHNHKDLGKRAVRQAIAYVLNRKQIAANTNPRTKQAPRVETALPNAQQDKWLGDSMSKFETYGRDKSMTDEAANVLKEEGYSKNDDGMWEDGDGKTLSFSVSWPAGWTDWETAMSSSIDQLQSFGMDVTAAPEPPGQISGKSANWGQGNFDATAGYWTAAFGRAAHPYFNLQYQMVDTEVLRPLKTNYPSSKEKMGGSEKDVTVPALDGSGTMTVNPVEKITKLGKTTDSDTEEKIALDMLWVSNQDLPMIPIQEKLTQTFLSSDGWDIPAADAAPAQVKYANTWLPRLGKLQATGQ